MQVSICGYLTGADSSPSIEDFQMKTKLKYDGGNDMSKHTEGRLVKLVDGIMNQGWFKNENES
jgi:hypothetical protein